MFTTGETLCQAIWRIEGGMRLSRRNINMRRVSSGLMLLFLFAVPSLVARAQNPPPAYIGAAPVPHITRDPDLEDGFRLLYELKFDAASEKFAAWEQSHPAEPLGPALEAAAGLFEEFYRQGVLTSEFFLDDDRLTGGITGKPDADLEARFLSTAKRAEDQSRARLADDPRDPDALFALTLTAGMRADNATLLEKRQLEGLHYLREGDRAARELLAVAPGTEDAYLAVGAANYIIGCMPGYKRAVLWMGGIHGDKNLGMQQVARAAASGHYLRPYAKLLLALAALREKNPDLARTEFSELSTEFPDNPLFARELAKIPPIVNGAPSSSVR
jgi:hypothetical protein